MSIAPHVLLVDDDPALLRVSSRALRAAGHAASATSDPAEAMALLESSVPGDALVAVLDVEMPLLDGIALARELRARRPRLPIVFASGLFEGAIHERAAGLEPFSVLAKPFAASRLVALVRALAAP